MATQLKINPVTRVEGHLEVDVTIEKAGGKDQVVEARVAGPMFRGFETIMTGRDPRDAVHYTQRICGVCPVSHAMAASLALEDAFGVTPPPNGRIIRNLVLGANFIQSHIIHFYHLALPDYIDTTGLLDMSPWKPRFQAADLIRGPLAAQLVGSYVQALAVRRTAHQMAAVYSGRIPGVANFTAGGSTERATRGSVSTFRPLLDEIRAFIDTTMLADAAAIAAAFPQDSELGRGPGNLLAYGVFDLNDDGSSKLLGRGRYAGGAEGAVDAGLIREYVAHSWFTPESGGLHPSDGVTEPAIGKDGAYSWVKAPRYEDGVYELGPLARMWVNGDYRRGISSMDRILARVQETKKVADAMAGWLDELVLGDPVYTHAETPQSALGVGLTEAPRGALGHWVRIEQGKIARYQVITPTAWNGSPRDDGGQAGAIEQALIGVPVSDMRSPLEVLRVVHSFDPCLACAVHMVRPGTRAQRPAAL
ncbi:MAG TPA: nickel-dependent hydrogenase large subunit [Planctomycetes bacterium]|nr:nickel-dependent hydrogenase large subunit [Planctomycetota bacterium]